jgi:hypothetical protein
MTMTPSERLLERLRQQGVEIPEGARIHRTYANGSARTGGAWSWFVLDSQGRELREGPYLGLGSYYPVKVCLCAPRLVISRERFNPELGRSVDLDPTPTATISRRTG